MRPYLPLALVALVLGGCTSDSVVVGTASETAESAPQETQLDGFDLGGADEVWVIGRYEERAKPQDHRHRFNAPGMTQEFFRAYFEKEGVARDREVEDLEPTEDDDRLSRLAVHAVPGCGGMVTSIEDRVVVVPLRHTAVDGTVQGDTANVTVRQSFVNPFDVTIEAKYVFPLPQNAAVHDFLMKIGERTIRGIVREREEAERIYAAARSQGYVASLLTQERPNIFTQSVANIAPQKAIDVEIAYFHQVPLRDGWYELVFPMVVGPRFNPPGHTGGVGAVRASAPGSSGQPVEVPYLRPEERSGHDVSLAFQLDAGTPIEALECKTHAVETNEPSPALAQVRLSPRDTLPNRDFVLRYRLAGDAVKAGLLTQRDGDAGYFTLTLHPPADVGRLRREPLELVFVVDGSGSMSGEPLALCQRALRHALQSLDPDDTFQVIRFSNERAQMAETPLLASAENLGRARRYIDALQADGGTMMIHGVEAALAASENGGRQRIVTFMTDGFIGNEEEILRKVKRHVGEARIFSFGVGSSPNRFLLEAMAREGRGVAAYFGPNDDPTEALDRFFGRIAHPALTSVEIDWDGLAVGEVFPSAIPDVFFGRPVTVVGRFDPKRSRPGATPAVHGLVAGAARTVHPLASTSEGPTASGALPKVWARTKIADLTSRARSVDGDASALQGQIKDVALEYGLMSAYTAFVAVDSMTRTEGEAVTVPVAVPVPEGVDYDKTVGGPGQ
ncbi:MAG: VWA domain-containing protein [bacterium]|nr:VWA domain-containing protein [bacterium]